MRNNYSKLSLKHCKILVNLYYACNKAKGILLSCHGIVTCTKTDKVVWFKWGTAWSTLSRWWWWWWLAHTGVHRFLTNCTSWRENKNGDLWFSVLFYITRDSRWIGYQQVAALNTSSLRLHWQSLSGLQSGGQHNSLP